MKMKRNPQFLTMNDYEDQFLKNQVRLLNALYRFLGLTALNNCNIVDNVEEIKDNILNQIIDGPFCEGITN